MLSVRTPPAITSKLAELCWAINPASSPEFIQITPEPGCEPNDCFLCVQRKVNKDGGKMQLGWALWECPNVFVEAEHHAVYEAPHGRPWKDITPSGRPTIFRRLFLPDDSATLDDLDNGIRRDNQRLAIVNDNLIVEYFRLAKEQTEIMNSVPGFGQVQFEGPTARRLDLIHRRSEEIGFKLAMKYTPRGSPCFCGSGEKFKRCHGAI